MTLLILLRNLYHPLNIHHITSQALSMEPLDMYQEIEVHNYILRDEDG